jgi:hypothetical protein
VRRGSVTFPELPDWIFEVQETSAGMYEVTAAESHGHRIQMTGTDAEAMVAECRELAARVAVRLVPRGEA